MQTRPDSLRGMAGRYTGSYLDRSNGWRAAAILADIGQASLVERIPNIDNMIFTAAAPTRPALPTFAAAQRRRLRFAYWYNGQDR